jgi:hypothetical protein
MYRWSDESILYLKISSIDVAEIKKLKWPWVVFSICIYTHTHTYIYISCYYTYDSNVIIVWVWINRTYYISYIKYNIIYTKIRFVMKSQKSWNEILPQTRGVYASKIRRYLHDVLVLIFILRERFIGLPNAQLLYDIWPRHRIVTVCIQYEFVMIILFCFVFSNS